MNLRVILLLLIALGIAGGTALFVRSYLAAQSVKPTPAQVAQPAPPKPKTRILVAKTDLRRGALLRVDDFVWKDWPEEAVLPTHVVEGRRGLETLVGHAALEPIPANEPINMSRLLSPGSRSFLAAVLAPDMRAISIMVTQTTGVAGLIQPGDRVDIILALSIGREKDGPSLERRLAEIVATGVRVLAIDQRFDQQAAPQSTTGQRVEAATAGTSRAVTFEVSSRQAQAVILASQLGQLTLALNAATTTDRGEAGEVALSDLAPAAQSRVIDMDIINILPPPRMLQSDQAAVALPGPTILRGGGKREETPPTAAAGGTPAAPSPGGPVPGAATPRAGQPNASAASDEGPK